MDEQKNVPTLRQLSAEEISAFCLQLSYPVTAGVSPVECVGLMLEETDVAGEKEILQPAYKALLEGATLGAALGQTGCFPDYMIQMLEIGQVSGNLDRVLHGLAEHYRKEAERSAGIRRAVTGPAVMLGVMAVIIFVLIVKVLPVFGQVFQQMGTQLSPLAKGLLGAGEFIQGFMAVIAVVLVAAAVAVFFVVKSRGGAARLGNMADRVFFGGRLGVTIGRARFASAMSLMTSGGMDLDQSLGYTQKLLEGNKIQESVAKCREMVAGGEAFPAAAQQAGIFTGILSGILSSGFRAGSMDKAVAELASRCQAQSEDMLERFITRIEPALIVVLSLSVGLVLLSVMLPLISMLSSIGM